MLVQTDDDLATVDVAIKESAAATRRYLQEI